jgi:hypothetical protein
VAVTVAPPCDDDGRERTGNYLLVDMYGMSLAALGSDLVWGGKDYFSCSAKCSAQVLLGALLSAPGSAFLLPGADFCSGALFLFG